MCLAALQLLQNFDLAQEDEPMLPVLASLRGLALRAGSYPEDLVVSHSGAGARQAAVAAPGGGGGGRNDDGGDEDDDEDDEEEDDDVAGGRMRKRDDGNQVRLKAVMFVCMGVVQLGMVGKRIVDL